MSPLWFHPNKGKESCEKERIRKHAVGPRPLLAFWAATEHCDGFPTTSRRYSSPLIDIQENRLLSSFVEPLNALLTHDDLPGAVDDFFGITKIWLPCPATLSHQNESQQPRRDPPRRKELDMLDPRRSKGVMGGIV
ncbi:hypothetical protein TNCT_416901, partial [Trichonephila clavata]